MTCREVDSFMMGYLSGELPEESRAAFDRHLTQCPNCVRYLAQYRETVAAGKAAFADPDAPAIPEVPEQLVRAILDLQRR